MSKGIVDVYLNKKTKNIVKNVGILTNNIEIPVKRKITIFEQSINSFYENFVFSKMNIDTLLDDYRVFFEKYHIKNTMMQEVLISMFDEALDYAVVIKSETFSEIVIYVAKLFVIMIGLEEITNSILNKNINYTKAMDYLNRKCRSLYTKDVKNAFKQNGKSLKKQVILNTKVTKKFILQIDKNNIKYNINNLCKNETLEIFNIDLLYNQTIFKGYQQKDIDSVISSYGVANEFALLKANYGSFEVMKEVFKKNKNQLYFIELPYNFFKLKSNITKLKELSDKRLSNKIVYLIPYKEFVEKDTKILEFKGKYIKIGIYDFKKIDSKTAKLKGNFNYMLVDSKAVENIETVKTLCKDNKAKLIIKEGNIYNLYEGD